MYNKIDVGAQNISQRGPGAFTGQVNGEQLRDMDVPWTIVGHSDRKIFGENQEDVGKKVREALNNNIKVIYCIGETSLDRGMGRDHDMHGLKEKLRNLMKILAPQ